MKDSKLLNLNGQTKPPTRSRAEINSLRELFGRDAVMITCKGKKATGLWKNRTADLMEDEDYLVSLGYMNIAKVRLAAAFLTV